MKTFDLGRRRWAQTLSRDPCLAPILRMICVGKTAFAAVRRP